ncbi:holo-[acyl-carrier-protein] synthase [Desulfocurvus sp.]|jgi:holo-[acyl-carrier protein] synthase|uniref:holo-[acyl-carrier-protein] synthase n=1 Tax=Desulfocurvus sp. TaxID=2871698 RepID=UPI0025C33A5C|nr:holo-[acyl-carrier-protein] synthase [Desulfocurvus sp.]MCK9239059.1 holo-[acyl-carrier-protein] synthase [Desulfocurvus sp.]
MIVGLGLDVVELQRVEAALGRFGDRFVRRILTPAEREGLPRAGAAAYLAARFAAKEAAAKALGTGIASGVGFQDMEILRLPSGQPELRLSGGAARRLGALGGTRTHVSLTHGRDTAAAVVVLERL